MPKPNLTALDLEDVFDELKEQVMDLEGFLDLSVVSDLVRRLEDLFSDASEAKDEADQAAEEAEPTEDEDSDE